MKTTDIISIMEKVDNAIKLLYDIEDAVAWSPKRKDGQLQLMMRTINDLQGMQKLLKSYIK